MFADRVLSGMRPTGSLHLGHYHGVLKNWLKLQQQYECLFFVADWHALTTHYDTPEIIEQNVWDMVIDWLAAGVDPSQAILFIQSKVPAHAELYLLLSMMTLWSAIVTSSVLTVVVDPSTVRFLTTTVEPAPPIEIEWPVLTDAKIDLFSSASATMFPPTVMSVLTETALPNVLAPIVMTFVLES